MPVITIEYDDAVIGADDVKALAEATRRAVIGVTGIEDVFVYANTAQIKVAVAPIEIFVQISASKVADLDVLSTQIGEQLKKWKREHNFATAINLTVIPMQWKFTIGI